jgi:DnaK suppressor protein
MDARTLKTLRKSLSEERDRLAADLADLEKAGHEALSDMSGENNYRDHMADQGTATFTKELDMSLEANVRDLLGQVDRALARIDADEYGTCTNCGKTIAKERLVAVPAADLCIECKEAEENL